ncbi:MAG: rRNA maturation RNase YbeY [Chloroflexota bacterium]
MINLQADQSFPDLPATDVLTRAAEQTLLAVTGSVEGDLSVILGSDGQLHELNRQFRGVDAPTDVLSFPDGEIDPDTGRPYLGDVLISVPRAEAQAAGGGHPLSDELQLLVVHGVLHLLGYDHADESEKAQMWALQGQILDVLACAARPAG